jgi:hypothetical protein
VGVGLGVGGGDFLFFGFRALEFHQRPDQKMQHDRERETIDEEILYPPAGEYRRAFRRWILRH